MASPTIEPAATSSPAIIVGAGLAGLVAAFELSCQSKPPVRTIILDQEGPQSLGGQAFWSLGGLFFAGSKPQRRMGIKDSKELAWRDWLGGARFDRLDKTSATGCSAAAQGGNSAKDLRDAAKGEGDDKFPYAWAEAFVDFASSGDFESYVKARGLAVMSNVGWAERGDGRAEGHGNSVPRFHITWGTGPEVVRVFAERVREAEKKGIVEFRFRHAVDELVVEGGKVVGVKGRVLKPVDAATPRGVATTRDVVGSFDLRGGAVLVSSGGIGGNVEAVKAAWPTDRLGPKVPRSFVVGVPAHVDGRMIGAAERAGARVINKDRMWHYTEGIQNWDPIWPGHGIRVLPAPSSIWLDATGKRLPPWLYPGADTLATLQHICSTGYDYSWFVLNQTIVAREFALSGSEQNSDITGKSLWATIQSRVLSKKGTPHVQAFVNKGPDFVVRNNLADLVAGMNELATEAGGPIVDLAEIRSIVEGRDAQLDNPYCKDAQIMLIRNSRSYWADGRRVAPLHKILDPAHGPLIAVRMHLLTRKTLGGIETDLRSRVQKRSEVDGSRTGVFEGLYAAGEAAGFGGGGVHGYSSMEGTFLGGCIFSGRAAGRAMAEELAGKAPKEDMGNVSARL